MSCTALIENPAVVECALLGAPDPAELEGNVVKAFVVLAEGHQTSEALTRELQDPVKDTTPYKYPRIIEYVKEFPKTTSGKIMRREPREKP